MTLEEILRLLPRLEQDRYSFETQWQEIADEVLGRKDFTVRQVTKGRRRDAIRYDSTGAFAADMLASAFFSFLISGRWFSLEPEDSDLRENAEVAAWLNPVEKIMLAKLDHAASRFSTQMHETFLDLVSFCTGSIMVEGTGDRHTPLLFSSRPLSEVFVLEDAAGRIIAAVRKYRLTNRQAVTEFGDDAPKALRVRAQGSPEGEDDYLHVLHPRKDPVLGSLTARGKPIRSVHVWLGGREQIREGGFWEMPLMVTRWEKDAGETYGRGPGIHALPDCKMANLQVKTVLKAGEKVADPPMMVADDGVINPTDTSPGALNVVKPSLDGQPQIQALPISPNLPITLEMIEATRQSIRGHFKFDLLELLRPQPSPITATQTLEVVESAQNLIAPQVSRQQVELLEPLLDRVFGILFRANHFPRPPDILRGQRLRIRYVSPVERARKAAETRAITTTLAVAGELAQLDREVLDNFDLDMATRLIGANSEADPRILRSEQAVRRQRAARARVLQEQAQRERDVQDAQLAPGLAQAEQTRLQ